MKKRFIAAPAIFVTLAIVFSFLLPSPARADGPQIVSLTGQAIGFVVYIVTYIVYLISGLLISVLTYFIGITLTLSNNVASTTPVQQGFSVTLAVANLGFVLAIIIIAIATILHRENYGIKKTLWKLIVAAILVNFSLIIGGSIVGFANSITNTFLEPFGGSPVTFADQLSGSFGPQRLLIGSAVDNYSASTGNSGTLSDYLSSSASAAVLADPFLSLGRQVYSYFSGSSSAGADLSSIFSPLVSLVFAAGFLVVVVITLAVLVFMLIIRYVMLAFLLILMPFIWLLWIFPSTSKHWSKWWSEFFRWTFFAPIVVFFLYLAIATASTINCVQTGIACTKAGDLAFITQGGYASTGDAGSPIVTSILEGTIIVGLAIGGMFAANKMSITGAGAAMGAMKATGNAVKNYAGKQGKKVAGRAYRGTLGDRGLKLEQRMQSLHGIPGVSALGRKIGQSVVNTTGKDLVDQSGKDMKVEGMSKEELIRAAAGARGHDNTLAVLMQAHKKGWLGDLGRVGGEASLADYYLKNERVFKDYGQGKFDGDISLNTGTREMIRAAQAKAAAAGAAAKVVDTKGLLGKAGNEVDAEALRIKAGETRAKAEEEISKQNDELTRLEKESAKGGFAPASAVMTMYGGKRVTLEEGMNLAKANLASAEQSKKDAEDAGGKAGDAVKEREERGNNAIVKNDKGEEVRAGELLREAAEKLMAGKKKEDISKSSISELFKGEAKYGLDKETIDAIGRAVAHGFVISAPGLAGTLAGKIDNSKNFKNFFSKYLDSIDEAESYKWITKAEAKDLRDAHKQIRQGVLLGYGGTPPEGGIAPTSPAPEKHS